jgi:hypothetical protein
MDGDGIEDLAVGAPLADGNGSARGAIYILFMERSGLPSSYRKISESQGLVGSLTLTLQNSDHFGTSVSIAADVNADGATDAIVGAPGCDSGGTDRGCFYLLYLTRGGAQALSYVKMDSAQLSGVNMLVDSDGFGNRLAFMLDLNNDRIPDIVVAASGGETGRW